MCGYEGALLTGSWPLPAASTKIKSWPLQDADLQHPLEKSSGWRQKIRHSVLWEKPGKTGLQIVKCFQGAIFYESKFLHLLIPRDTLMSWTNVWTWFSWTAPPQLSHFCQSLGHVSLTFLSLFFQAAVQQKYPPANTQTMLEQAALSFCGLISLRKCTRGPQATLPLRSYMGDHPQW